MAVLFAPNSTLLVGNAGGAVQSLPNMQVGGKVRVFTEVITLASQVFTNSIMFARVPYGSLLRAIWMSSSVSLGTSTIALGDANSSTRYAAAAVFTTVNVPADLLIATQRGIQITTAYDNGGAASLAYTDLLATIGVANLPASGTLVFQTEYEDYGS